MKILKLLLIALILAKYPILVAQLHNPHIGYIYPAGAKQGTTVEVIIGGMALSRVERATISGEGVTVESLHSFTPFNRISNDLRRELLPILKALSEGRNPLEASKENSIRILSRLKKQKVDSDTIDKKNEKTESGASNETPKVEPLKKGAVKNSVKPTLEEQLAIVPGERLIYIDMTPEEVVEKIRSLSPMEHDCLLKTVFGKKSVLQATPALDQIIVAKINVAENATPGVRELRVFTKNGESNPLLFVVGILPEIIGHAFTVSKKSPPRAIKLPVVVNGQIMPGEVDRLLFDAEKGKKYSIEVAGRKLIPFLGDAVPGWFQAVIEIADKDGKVIAFDDDNKFNPDPALEFLPPYSGTYELRIRDSIYRGREDFVYRITVKEGELQRLQNRIKTFNYQLPVMTEREPDNSCDTAQKVEYPSLITGAIKEPGDIDVFAFNAKKNEKVAIEIIARRLNSPVDSKIYLLNSAGKILAWNDDYKWGNFGTETHHADSYLLYDIQEDGEYFVKVADTQNHGGEEFFYNLRIDKASPDFAIYANPSVLNVRSGMSIPLTFHISRKDGFDEAVDVAVSDAPEGVHLDGVSIQHGDSKARMTMFVPGTVKPGNYKIKLVGRAEVNGKTISRNVIPAEDIMQAFLWRHIVPALSMNMNVLRKGVPPLYLKTKELVISPGGTATVEWINRAFKAKKHYDLTLQLDAPPKGLSLLETKSSNKNIITKLALAEDAEEWSGNIIFKLMINRPSIGKKQSTYPVGYMPAIPCSIRKK